MRFKRNLELISGQLDIAPLIDIVFQLLIFFMLTSTFVTQPGIKINLPKAVTSEVVNERTLILTISSENLLYLDTRLISTRDLRVALKLPENKERPILIRADRKASMGRVVEIWDICREMGIARINIATSEPR